MHKNYPRAAFFALAAFCSWTFSDALLKLVRTDGTPLGQILLISGVSGMVLIFALTAVRGNIRRLQPHQWSGLCLLGACQTLAAICWIMALPHLHLTSMYTIAFMTPMTVACLATLFLKEHLGWKRAVPIAAGFGGVVLSVNPMNLLHDTGVWLPYLCVFGSMSATATQMLLLRAVGHKESSESTSFYPRLAIVAAGTLSCIFYGFAAMKPWAFFIVCASGALGASGWALLANAYKNAAAAAVAPFHYSQMITGALLGYLVWSDVPSPYLLAGAAVIIVSGIYLVRHERRVSRMMVRVD